MKNIVHEGLPIERGIENRIKVLEISNYPPPHLGWGVRVRYLKERLLEEGHSCIVLNIGENRKIKSTEYEDIQGGLDLLKKLIKYLRKGYLVHMHACGDSPKGFVLTLLVEGMSLMLGRRCVLTFHAGANQVYFPKRNSKWFIPVFLMVFGLPKTIICNSEEVKKGIMEYGVQDKKIIPIPAFSRQYLSFNENSVPPDLDQFIKNKKEILTTSLRFDPRYYVDVLLEAFSKTLNNRPDLGLVITGPLKGEEEGQRLISKFGIENNVFIAGDLEHDVFLSLLKWSKLYIRTPTTDGVSSSVMEALSLGVPVIASENHTRPKSVFTYPPDNTNALYEMISYILENLNEVKHKIKSPTIKDTLKEEVDLLIRTFLSEK